MLAGFFFHDRGSDIQKSLAGMLQGILHQILDQAHQLSAIILPFYATLVRAQRTKPPVWATESLKSVLLAFTEQRNYPTCLCLFLDALDEHSGDNGQLASLIHKLTSNADNDKVKIKICLASRPWTVFESHFGSCPGFAIHNHTRNDIQSYTTSRLRQPLGIKATTQGSNSLQRIEALAEQVTEKARRVFIWVRLVVDRLEKDIQDGTPFSTLEEMVSAIPQELEDLYRHTLRRIEPEYAKEAYIMLQIVLCALWPLRLETFIKCTSYNNTRKFPDDEEEDSMIRRLVSRSGGLLETVTRPAEVFHSGREGYISGRGGSSVPAGSPEHEGTLAAQQPESQIEEVIGGPRPDVVTVQFIHQTVKDYVRENRSDLGLQPHDTQQQCGYLYFLQLGTAFVEAPWAHDISSQVFEYAHLTEKDEMLDEEMYQLALNNLLLDSTSHSQGRLSSWLSSKMPHMRLTLYGNEQQNLLCLAVAAGLHRFVSFAVRRDSEYWTSTSTSNDRLISLLQFAAEGDSIISKSLGPIDHGQNVIGLWYSRGSTLLCLPVI